MNISKIFQLTEEDKAEYQLLIDKIDLNDASKIIDMLKSKLDTMTTSKSLNSIETDLIKYVSVLLNIYQTNIRSILIYDVSELHPKIYIKD